MHLILTGATGLVGSSVLNYILSLPAGQVTRLSILSRSPVSAAQGHANVEVIQHADFGSYPPDVLERLRGAQGCIWALGVSQNAAPKAEYIKVTKDWTLAAADAFKDLPESGTPFTFVFVSGEGATTTPGFFTPLFGTTKGAAEAGLHALATAHPTKLLALSLRPGFVDGLQDPALRSMLAARPKTLATQLNDRVGGVLRTVLPSMVSPTPALGRVLAGLAMGRDEGRQALRGGKEVLAEGTTITNVGFRRMAGL